MDACGSFPHWFIECKSGWHRQDGVVIAVALLLCCIGKEARAMGKPSGVQLMASCIAEIGSMPWLCGSTGTVLICLSLVAGPQCNE